MRKVYISGPMRGVKDHNHSEFCEAQQRLEQAGYQVFNPSAIARCMGYGPPGTSKSDSEQIGALRHVFQSDIACLYSSYTIALLPGWERSVGARAEYCLAMVLGLKVVCAKTLVPLEVDVRIEFQPKE